MDPVIATMVIELCRQAELKRLRATPMDELVRAACIREVDAALRNAMQDIHARADEDRRNGR